MTGESAEHLVSGLIGACFGATGTMLLHWWYYGRYPQPVDREVYRKMARDLVRAATGRNDESDPPRPA